MSKLHLYALKDTLIGEYENPVLFHNDEEVKRSVGVALMHPSKLDEKLGDMQLYHVADYDTITGDVTGNLYFVDNLVNLKKGNKEENGREEENKESVQEVDNK